MWLLRGTRPAHAGNALTKKLIIVVLGAEQRNPDGWEKLSNITPNLNNVVQHDHGVTIMAISDDIIFQP